MAFCSAVGGKMARCKSGHSAPSTEGPSMRPPSSMPITDGWPMRFMISPKRRPTVISTMTWARKTTSDAPLLPVSAASDGAVLSARTAAAQKQGRVPSRAAAKIGVEQVMRRPAALSIRHCRNCSRQRLKRMVRHVRPAIANYLQEGYPGQKRKFTMTLSSVPQERSSPASAYPEPGWRRRRSTPSLSEVFGSVSTRPRGPLWKKLLAFLGPGYLVAVGYMDPGNWATSLAGGSKFGYALLVIALLSNVMAILLQALCARLGIGAGRDLAQACSDAFPRALSWPLWLLAEIAICATDLAEVIGTAIGLNLLFKIALEIGVILTELDVLLILGMQHLGFRWVESFVVALLGVIAGCFAVQIASEPPD